MIKNMTLLRLRSIPRLKLLKLGSELSVQCTWIRLVAMHYKDIAVSPWNSTNASLKLKSICLLTDLLLPSKLHYKRILQNNYAKANKK